MSALEYTWDAAEVGGGSVGAVGAVGVAAGPLPCAAAVRAVAAPALQQHALRIIQP